MFKDQSCRIVVVCHCNKYMIKQVYGGFKHNDAAVVKDCKLLVVGKYILLFTVLPIV